PSAAIAVRHVTPPLLGPQPSLQCSERCRLRLRGPRPGGRGLALRRHEQPALHAVALLLVGVVGHPPPDEVAHPAQRHLGQLRHVVSDGVPVDVPPVLDRDCDQPLGHVVGFPLSWVWYSLTFSMNSVMCSMSIRSLGSCSRCSSFRASSSSNACFTHSMIASRASLRSASFTRPFLSVFTDRARAMDAMDLGTKTG